MEDLKNPITLIPCGHNYCEKCIAGDADECKECSKDINFKFRNKNLEDIISKIAYNKVIFESLKK